MSTNEEICGLKIHTSASILPLIEVKSKEFKELVESIRTSGLLVPIVLGSDGTVIDGRNRLRAIELLRDEGVAVPLTTTKVAADTGVTEFVLAANLTRRHLTTDQRVAIVAELIPLIEAESAAAKKATQIVKGKAPTVRSDSTEPKKGKRDHAAEAKRSTAGKVAEIAKSSVSKGKQIVAATKAEAKGELPAGTVAAVKAGEATLATVTKSVTKGKQRQATAQAADTKKPPEVSPLEAAVSKRWKQMRKHDSEWGVGDMTEVCALFLRVIKQELDQRKAGTFRA